MSEEKKVQNPTPETSNQVTPASEEVISVPKSTLMGILSRLDKYDKMLTEPTESGKNRRVVPKNRTASVRFWNGKMVVGYGKSWEEQLQHGKTSLRLEVFFEGEDKPEIFDHNFFRQNSQQEICEIIKMESEDKEIEVGTTTIKKVKWGEYSTEDTGEETPLLVTSKVLTFTLKLKNGREVVLPEEALN